MFCIVCILIMFVEDAIDDHVVEAYSGIGLVMALYISLCMSHMIDERNLSIDKALDALAALLSMCLY